FYVRPFAVTKSGGGTWTLTGTNVYSGGTTVNEGKLVISNTAASGTGSGTVTVNSGATLGGTGTIVNTLGPVKILSGATLAPGSSINSRSATTSATMMWC